MNRWNQYIDAVISRMTTNYYNRNRYNICHVIDLHIDFHESRLIEYVHKLPIWHLTYKFPYCAAWAIELEDIHEYESYLRPRILFLKSLKEAV